MNALLNHPASRTARLSLAIARGRPIPYSVSFTLTNRCNLRCVYCDIPEKVGDELTTEEFKGAIRAFVGAGMARASFSGGEALLRDDAIAIIEHAKALRCFTSLNSNGLVTARHLDALAGCLDMLMVSLDGPREVHDVVRRRKGSYAHVLETIDGARARGISVATISVLGPWNLDRIDEVLALAREHGFWAYFQPAYVDCFEQGAGLHPEITPAILAQVADHLDRARASSPVGSSPGYFERLAAAPNFGDCARCAAGRYFATVLPDGHVVPCHLTSGQAQYANGREVGFVEAFHAIPRPSGPGCAVSPYQESDLIFGLDARAVGSALRRAFAAPRGTQGP